MNTDYNGEEKTLLILGAGGLGQVVAESVQMSGEYTNIAFLDDEPTNEKERLFHIIGKISDADKFVGQFSYAIPAFGNNERRFVLMKELKNIGFKIPRIIHHSAILSPTAKIGEGTIIRPRAAISRNVVIGDCCLINMGALIDHKCVIGDCTHIPMGCVVRNEVTIPPMSTFAPNSVVE